MNRDFAVRGLWRAALILGCSALGLVGIAHGAALDASAEQRVRAGTFEVVQLKPAEGAIEYERPLPMDLIPFQQRNDKYRSIGTAFAIAPNRYVTASHVLQLGMGSQFGPPALRDAAGHVYEIDQVFKYSDREDYAVFSLKQQPARVRTLAAGDHPKANDTVFAVGNALGEGVVIRDGVYTSDTPEEMNGDWQWLRFSAAASPGNSGGPLVDQQGHVLGVVLRKTEAENLNYALPISRLLSDADGTGRLEGRRSVRLVVLPSAAETDEVHEQFLLPLPLQQLYQTVSKLTNTDLQKAQTRLIANNSARLFPHGDNSDAQLHQAPGSPFPRFVRMRQDGQWAVQQNNPPVMQLGANGFMRTLNGIVRLRAPDDVPLTKLYGDSKLLMDLVLKGFPLQRNVGGEQVRVTSLGKAEDLGSYTDAWGRSWQIRSWDVPYADLKLAALCLPTPEGYDLVLLPLPSGFRDGVLTLTETLTNYLYLTMQGSLARWQEYLAIPGVQPRAFASFKLAIDPDKYVRYESRRFKLEVTRPMVMLSKDSILSMNLAFYRDGDAVVWDVAGLFVKQDEQHDNWVQIARLSAPESSLPQGFQVNWNNAQSHAFPFNGSIISGNGTSTVRAIADGTGSDAKVRYALSVVGEGSQPQESMAQQLGQLQHAFKALER